MVRRTLQLILLLLTSSSLSFAGGSTFGANGLGEQLILGGTRARGLAGGGLGLADTVSFNTQNPALLGFARSALYRMSGQAVVWQVHGKELDDTDGEVTWTDLHLFLPITSRWNLGFGLEPSRRVQLKTFVTRDAVFNYEGADTSIAYEERIVWSGGTTNLVLENGVRLHDRLALGVTFAYSFINLNRDATLDFGTSDYRDAVFAETARFKGWWTRLGIFWQPLKQLGVGGYYRPSTGGDWELEAFENDGSEPVVTNRDGDVPSELGGGISIRFKPEWVFTADVQTQEWSRRDLGILYDDDSEITVENPLFLSFAIEKQGKNEFIGGSIIDWPWRAGVFSRAHYWTDANGDQITDVGGVLGTSIPIANWLGRLHLAGEYGHRAGADVSEDFVRISAQVEMSELWFQRDKPRIPK